MSLNFFLLDSCSKRPYNKNTETLKSALMWIDTQKNQLEQSCFGTQLSQWSQIFSQSWYLLYTLTFDLVPIFPFWPTNVNCWGHNVLWLSFSSLSLGLKMKRVTVRAWMVCSIPSVNRLGFCVQLYKLGTKIPTINKTVNHYICYGYWTIIFHICILKSTICSLICVKNLYYCNNIEEMLESVWSIKSNQSRKMTQKQNKKR